MSIDFTTLLSAESKRAVVEQRIQQLSVEAYQLSLNVKVLELQPEPNENALLEINNNLTILSQMIDVYTEELNSLGDSN